MVWTMNNDDDDDVCDDDDDVCDHDDDRRHLRYHTLSE